MPNDDTMTAIAEQEHDCQEAERAWLAAKEAAKEAREILDEAVADLRRMIRRWKEDDDKIELLFGEEVSERVAQLDAEANSDVDLAAMQGSPMAEGARSQTVSFGGSDFDAVANAGKELRKRGRKAKDATS